MGKIEATTKDNLMVRQVAEVGEEASVWIEYRTVANAPPDAKRVKTHNEH